MPAELSYVGECPNTKCGREVYCDPVLTNLDCPYCGHTIPREMLHAVLSDENESPQTESGLPEGTQIADTAVSSSEPGSAAAQTNSRFVPRAVFRGALFAVVSFQLMSWIFVHLLHQSSFDSYNEPLNFTQPFVLLTILFLSAFFGGMSASRLARTFRIQHAAAVGFILIAVSAIFDTNPDISLAIQSFIAVGGSIAEPVLRKTTGLPLGPLRSILSYGPFSKFWGLMGFGAIYFAWQAPSKSFGDIVQSAFLSGFFGGLAVIVRSVEQTLLQRHRDLEARRILHEASPPDIEKSHKDTIELATENPRGPAADTIPQATFFLYLRPFSTTGQLISPNPEYVKGPMAPRAYTQPQSVEFETRLAHVIESLGSLVAFGRPGEHYGAGRVLATEDEWRANFKSLASRAKAIFVIPLNAPSTQWEVDWLIQAGLIAKCVFVMPPRPSDLFASLSRSWAEARTILLDKGITLPEYSDGGSLFKVELNGGHSPLNPIGGLSNRRLRKIVLDLVKGSTKRTKSRLPRILWLLAAGSAVVAVLWFSLNQEPTVPSREPGSEPNSANIAAQVATGLPDGGTITNGNYFSEKWKLRYDLPVDWTIQDVRTTERYRTAVQTPAENAEDRATESHALLFIASPSERANLTIAAKKLPSIKVTAADVTDSDRLAASERGLNPIGPISQFTVENQVYARSNYAMANTEPTFYSVEQNTVCKRYLFSFLITGASQSEVYAAVESLRSLRFEGCK